MRRFVDYADEGAPLSAGLALAMDDRLTGLTVLRITRILNDEPLSAYVRPRPAVEPYCRFLSERVPQARPLFERRAPSSAPTIQDSTTCAKDDSTALDARWKRAALELYVHPALEKRIWLLRASGILPGLGTLRPKLEPQVGGKVLGRGRSGTRVFTLDDLRERNPDMVDACVQQIRGRTEQTTRCIPVSDIPVSEHGGIVVKQIPDSGASDIEVKVNDVIRTIFGSPPHLLRLTVLHPQYALVHVATKQGAKRTSVTYRAMRGSLLQLWMQHLPRGLDENTLRAALRHTLEFLEVMHAHGFLHLDIKQDNVMYEDVPDGGISFAVGDYGLVYTAEEVFQQVRRRDRFHVGTDGYVSPLLLHQHDEADNRVYRKFAWAARSAGVFPTVDREELSKYGFWDAYFGRYKRAMLATGRPSVLAKADLQSAGLMLHDLLTPEQRDTMFVAPAPAPSSSSTPSIASLLTRLLSE